ncbi:MAG TPA: hypothetical protein VMG35_24485 [Bryobacteraceae bacterium]|nr:hypothetical protein [Bryobacteraceae bacterium]
MRELNWKRDQTVELHVLGDGACAGSARILELSGKRLHLVAALPLKKDAAVRLEWDGQLLLGEVLNVEPGGFWIEIHHMLLDSAEAAWQKQGWLRG